MELSVISPMGHYVGGVVSSLENFLLYTYNMIILLSFYNVCSFLIVSKK